MPTTRTTRSPSFWVQGALILLPVLGLASLGLYALWQDQVTVEQEARQRAQEYARDLSNRFGPALREELSELVRLGDLWHGRAAFDGLGATTEHGFSSVVGKHADLEKWQANYPKVRPEEIFPLQAAVSGNGELLWPKNYPNPPMPGAWLNELSVEQRSLWHQISQLRFANGEPDGIHAACAKFLSTDPPASAKASAEFLLLSSELKAKPPAVRAEARLQFAKRYPDLVSEGGLPLASLALSAALKDASAVTEALLQALHAQLLDPSILTPHLMEAAERAASRQPQDAQLAVGEVRMRWASQERLRELTRTAQTILPANRISSTGFWFEWQQARWLALFGPGEAREFPVMERPLGGLPNGIKHFQFFPKSAVEQAAQNTWRKLAMPTPDYYAVHLRLENEPILGTAPPGVETLPVLLANHATSASLMPFGTDGDARPSGDNLDDATRQPLLTIDIFLGNPQLLYAQARKRAWVFGGLIAAAAATAMLGLVKTAQALRRQQRLNEMKTNFVSSVSHELRAPIASVRLMAERLESGRVQDEPKRQQYFEFIVRECHRLSALIENVLDFSRIEQGRKQYEFEPADIEALVRDTVKGLEPYAAEQGVTFALELRTVHQRAGDAHPVVDSRAIQQALVNLLDNAVKHSPKGSMVEIGLDFALADKPDSPTAARASRPTPHASRSTLHATAGRLLLWVEDHGDGIPPAEHERIFERFYRCGSELRRETQGAGIGLSIVKHIVEAHGGTVEVRSSAGQGSRFTIELPMTPVEEQPA